MSMGPGLRMCLLLDMQQCIGIIEETSVEPEKHIHVVHASKVTRATTVLASSVMSASHKDLASGGECGVELRSYDWRHHAEHGLPLRS